MDSLCWEQSTRPDHCVRGQQMAVPTLRALDVTDESRLFPLRNAVSMKTWIRILRCWLFGHPNATHEEVSAFLMGWTVRCHRCNKSRTIES